jgi:16S rRNA (cytosine967-C5)-methyltransferase
LTRDSLAVAIEALSWMAYAGIGERTALFKAAEQLGVTQANELRQAHRLIMETARFQNRLEGLISRSQDRDKIRRTPHGVTSFLKILAYLKYVENKPEKDLIQSVSWARQILGWKELHPLEKGIALIASGSLDLYDDELSESERLALETCHPVWFVERTIRVFGRAFALRILRRNLSLLPTYIRLNALKISNKASVRDIACRIRGSRLQQLDYVLKVERARSVLARSSLFESGEIVLQDLASIVTGLVASPKQGAVVVDVCAAPGNKTSHLAAIMENKGEIYSIDASQKRLSHWKTEMHRTGVSIAYPIRTDAMHIPLSKEADLVLVDPPCSNTGVFARNPSIKWNTTTSRVDDLAIRQYSILRAASEHVAQNGTLVYCTCSILPEENELVIDNFLRRHQDFRLVPQTPLLGSPGLGGLDQCQRFYPHLHDCNGYFIAKLRRID